jgi:hypothetical protein
VNRRDTACVSSATTTRDMLAGCRSTLMGSS